MNTRSLRISHVILVASVLALPALSFSAEPFGGRASYVKPCYNETIYALLGPPRGGPFVWYSATKTYQFGPPRAAGQWILGLAGPPYYCLAYVSPVTTWPGKAILMMGSSGPSSPAISVPQAATTSLQFPNSLSTTPPADSATTPSPAPSTP